MLKITGYALEDAKHGVVIHVSECHKGWEFWSDDIGEPDTPPLPDETYPTADDAIRALTAWYETRVFEGDQS